MPSPAAEFLKSRGKTAPSEPIKIHLVADAATGQTDAEGAPAVFRFVSDHVKADADADASRQLAALDVPITDEIRAAYQHSNFLHAAIRSADNPASPFFDSAKEARSMLLPSERVRLIGGYQMWIEKFAPLSPETLKEAMADAETFTSRALLTKYGYDTARRLLIFLAMTLTKSPTP